MRGLWIRLPIAALPLIFAACGGSKPAADAATAKGDEAPSAEPADKPSEHAAPAKPESDGEGASASNLGECHGKGGLCLPDPRFVKRLCNNRYPSMALYLFSKKFAKGYLTRKTEAWNASGGASAGGFIEFDEEVLLLIERKADTGGMQVSGAGGGYDALRWDGSCVTLAKEEVTLSTPPSPKTITVEWRFLDDNVQEGLRKDKAVNDAYLARRKECKGAVSGDVSAKCVKADSALSAAIVAFIRHGGDVPMPTTAP